MSASNTNASAAASASSNSSGQHPQAHSLLTTSNLPPTINNNNINTNIINNASAIALPINVSHNNSATAAILSSFQNFAASTTSNNNNLQPNNFLQPHAPPIALPNYHHVPTSFTSSFAPPGSPQAAVLLNVATAAQQQHLSQFAFGAPNSAAAQFLNSTVAPFVASAAVASQLNAATSTANNSNAFALGLQPAASNINNSNNLIADNSFTASLAASFQQAPRGTIVKKLN